MNRRDTDPRLVLFAPPADALLAEACAKFDIASAILHTGALDERAILSRAEALWNVTSKTGAALLLGNRADLVAKTKADGAHLSNFPEQAAQIKLLQPRYIAGAAGLASRHDAMLAGEAGADYVMFGEPVNGKRPSLDAIIERVAWWAEIFETPCVAYSASLDEIPALVRAGADFVALDKAIWSEADPLNALRRAALLLEPERAE
ncbi:MAG TPA: thiamine phosphate synthase [Xanthobacteraceae bacterium]|nr:thiamine phosphate synthase [Xanthobacteraceae bacterium]